MSKSKQEGNKKKISFKNIEWTPERLKRKINTKPVNIFLKNKKDSQTTEPK